MFKTSTIKLLLAYLSQISINKKQRELWFGLVDFMAYQPL